MHAYRHYINVDYDQFTQATLGQWKVKLREPPYKAIVPLIAPIYAQLTALILLFDFLHGYAIGSYTKDTMHV